MISSWLDAHIMYTTECSKTGCLQETEESMRVPTGEGVLIIDEVKVNVKLQYLFIINAHLIVQYTHFNMTRNVCSEQYIAHCKHTVNYCR